MSYLLHMPVAATGRWHFFCAEDESPCQAEPVEALRQAQGDIHRLSLTRSIASCLKFISLGLIFISHSPVRHRIFVIVND